MGKINLVVRSLSSIKEEAESYILSIDDEPDIYSFYHIKLSDPNSKEIFNYYDENVEILMTKTLKELPEIGKIISNSVITTGEITKLFDTLLNDFLKA